LPKNWYVSGVASQSPQWAHGPHSTAFSVTARRHGHSLFSSGIGWWFGGWWLIDFRQWRRGLADLADSKGWVLVAWKCWRGHPVVPSGGRVLVV